MLRVYILENIIVLIYGLRPYFVLSGLHKPSFVLFVLHNYFLFERNCVYERLSMLNGKVLYI